MPPASRTPRAPAWTWRRPSGPAAYRSSVSWRVDITVSRASSRASASVAPTARAAARASNARRTCGNPARASPRAPAAPYFADTDEPCEGLRGARLSVCRAMPLAVAVMLVATARGSRAAAATSRPRAHVAPRWPPPARPTECSVQRPIAPSSVRSPGVGSPVRRAAAAIAARPGTSALADQRREQWSRRVTRASRSRGSGSPGLGARANCPVSAVTAACASASSSRLLMAVPYEEAEADGEALPVGTSLGGVPVGASLGGVPPPLPAPVLSASGSMPRVRKPL
ncbi:hypothetical protein QF037_004888 [Streptomyces canus]|nr:hypothetical protein [Streptomyces canus]